MEVHNFVTGGLEKKAGLHVPKTNQFIHRRKLQAGNAQLSTSADLSHLVKIKQLGTRMIFEAWIYFDETCSNWARANDWLWFETQGRSDAGHWPLC